jgi:hypothetical protein
MKISMKTLASGPNGVLRPGEVYNLSDEEAKQLIEGRYAEAVEDAAPPHVTDAEAVVATVEDDADENDGDDDHDLSST